MTPNDSEGYLFQIFSLNDEKNGAPCWTLHAFGSIEADEVAAPPADASVLSRESAKEIDVEQYYRQCCARGIDFGPGFQALEQLWRREDEGVGRIALPNVLKTDHSVYQAHPVLLDACFQVLGALSTEAEEKKMLLPVGLEHLRLFRPLDGELWVAPACVPLIEIARRRFSIYLYLLPMGKPPRYWKDCNSNSPRRMAYCLLLLPVNGIGSTSRNGGLLIVARFRQSRQQKPRFIG